MKKIYLLLSVIALFAMGGCLKDKLLNKSFDNEALINEIFSAGMSGYSNAQGLKSQGLKSTIPMNISVDKTVPGPEGGNIHVLGSITGSMSFNDQTGYILGGTLLLGFTETINDYAFMSNGQTYTMNGAPYISLAGTFTLQPGGTTFGTASSMEIGGGVRVVGSGIDKTINIQITININSSGTGGDVSGTIDGKSVNYSF
jgi:hypothetical protein